MIIHTVFFFECYNPQSNFYAFIPSHQLHCEEPSVSQTNALPLSPTDYCKPSIFFTCFIRFINFRLVLFCIISISFELKKFSLQYSAVFRIVPCSRFYRRPEKPLKGEYFSSISLLCHLSHHPIEVSPIKIDQSREVL